MLWYHINTDVDYLSIIENKLKQCFYMSLKPREMRETGMGMTKIT